MSKEASHLPAQYLVPAVQQEDKRNPNFPAGASLQNGYAQDDSFPIHEKQGKLYKRAEQ